MRSKIKLAGLTHKFAKFLKIEIVDLDLLIVAGALLRAEVTIQGVRDHLEGPGTEQDVDLLLDPKRKIADRNIRVALALVLQEEAGEPESVHRHGIKIEMKKYF